MVMVAYVNSQIQQHARGSKEWKRENEVWEQHLLDAAEVLEPISSDSSNPEIPSYHQSHECAALFLAYIRALRFSAQHQDAISTMILYVNECITRINRSKEFSPGIIVNTLPALHAVEICQTKRFEVESCHETQRTTEQIS